MTPAPPRKRRSIAEYRDQVRDSRSRVGAARVGGARFSPLWLVGALLVIMPIVATELQLRRFTQLLVLVLAVMGVNLITGYAGVFSLGHGVFVGIGGFAMAELVDDRGFPMLPALITASVIAGLFGVVLGLPALRIRGVYLALITFGFALAFGPIARRLGGITGGPTGRTVEADFSPPAWTGLGTERTQLYRYLVCLIVVAVFFWIMFNLVNSRVGRSIRALRDDQLAAQVFGVNPTLTKTAVFGLSSAMAGASGALQVFLFPFVSHDNFDVFLSLRLYAAAVLGGLGTIVGAVYGVIALIVVPALNGIIGFIGSESVAFGLGLVVLTYLAPDGVAGVIDRWQRRRP